MTTAEAQNPPLSKRELLLGFVPTELVLDEPLARIETLLKPEEFEPGYRIVRQREPGDKMYLLSEGEVQVRRWKLPGMDIPENLAILRPGAVFGEIALVLNVLRTADIVALTPVRTFSLSRDDWQNVKAFFPGFAGIIEQIARGRYNG